MIIHSPRRNAHFLRNSQTADGTTRITVTFEVPSRENIGAPLDLERGLQRVLNGVGQTIITEALERFDTEGEPILLGSIAMTSNGRSPECYKSLFGPIELRRHTYQSSEGRDALFARSNRAPVFAKTPPLGFARFSPPSTSRSAGDAFSAS